MTDEAWAAETDTSAAGGPDASRLIAELSAYRYGGGEPTSFAVKDAVQRALQCVESAPSAQAANAGGSAA